MDGSLSDVVSGSIAAAEAQVSNTATAEAPLAAGWALLHAGAHEAALHQFDAAAAALPACAEAHGGRGEALLALGRHDDAAAALARARALDAGCTAWSHGHAEALTRCGRRSQAIAVLREILRLRPGHAGTLVRLGALLEQTQEPVAAQEAYREAVYAGAGREAMLPLGRLLLAADRPVEAVTWLQRCLRLDPEDCEAHARLGAAYAALAERERARHHLRRALAIDPGNPYDCAIVLAEVENERPEALPAAYTRSLFDQYAERFDDHLLQTLNYRGHRVAAGALAEALGERAPVASVVDLGCGTGLAGPLLRPLAATLTGVDLSPGMAAKARARGVYDRVEVADLVVWLEQRHGACEAAIAADVVAYLGDLGPLMHGLAHALRPGGVFVATAEQVEGDDDQVALKPTRRFGHGAGHIRARAAAAGLDVLRLEAASARTERGEPVAGWLMVLARP